MLTFTLEAAISDSPGRSKQHQGEHRSSITFFLLSMPSPRAALLSMLWRKAMLLVSQCASAMRLRSATKMSPCAAVKLRCLKRHVLCLFFLEASLSLGHVRCALATSCSVLKLRCWCIPRSFICLLAEQGCSGLVVWSATTPATAAFYALSRVLLTREDSPG